MSDKSYVWSNIDRASRPEKHATYLDSVTALDAVRQYKQISYQLLRIGPGARVLDVGCGVGDDARELAGRVGPAGHVVAIDKSEALIEQAQNRTRDGIRNLTFEVQDAARLPYEAGAFDACRADRIFIHLPDRPSVLAEMIRVTRTHGWIVISDPDWDTLIIDSPQRALTRRIQAIIADFTANPWTGRQLRRLMLDAGLQDVTVANPVTAIITDYDVANHVFSLEENLAAIGEGDGVSPEQARQWLEQLQEADRRGVFFSGLTAFTVAGRKAP